MSLEKNYLSLNVSDSDKNLQYWLAQPYVNEDLATQIKRADVLVLPWEDFRPDEPVLFPNGSTDFYRRLAIAVGSERVTLVATPDLYREIALHANVWRFPALFVTVVALPILVNVISSEIDSRLHHKDDKVELNLVVSAANHHCVQIDYKGPADGAVEKLADAAMRYCGVDVSKGRAHGHAKHK
ncbi:hypothetical protein [Burkholderia pseudomallei]|uniref:hypothetical protein n=1 Tax=Burkholderia pseudomallei TaxID=28450 RepID=UPI0011C4B3FE|nr:hypothetical protein [Burkholderia pseudomallei]